MVLGNRENPYDIIRQIMKEEMEMSWSSNAPQNQPEAQPQSTVAVDVQPQNPDIQYIGQLVNEIKNKLDSLYQLNANSEEGYNLQTHDIIRTLLDISNIIDQPLDQLNLLNNLKNNAAQNGATTQVIF